MKIGSESGFIFALLPFLFTPGGLKANMLSQRSSLAVEFNLLRFVQPISNGKRKKRGGGLNKSEINKDNFLLVAGCKKAASALAAFHSAGLLAPQAGRVRRPLSGLDHRVASLHFSTGNNPSSRRRLLACFVHLIQTHTACDGAAASSLCSGNQTHSGTWFAKTGSSKRVGGGVEG